MKFLILSFSFLLVLFSPLAQESPDALTGVITDQAILAPGIVVPKFFAQESKLDSTRDIRATVRYDLDFSGLMKLNPDPDGFSYQGGALDKETIVGLALAESSFLALATYSEKDGQAVLEARLYDATRGDLVFGKRYRTDVDHLRSAAHKFSGDILEALFGERGPGGSKLLFVGRVGKQGKEIYLSDYDGEDLLKLTALGKLNMMPDVNLGGKNIAFVSFMHTYPEVYILDKAGQRTKVYGNFEGLNSSPSFSPDGTRIAFSTSRDGNSEIYVINLDGSNLQRLTSNPAIDTSPEWSPTGQEIAFISDRLGRPTLFMMDASGGNVRRASAKIGRCDSPAWSPDGTRIAMSLSVRGKGWQIGILDLVTEELEVITRGPGNNESPSWSPSGRHIAYASSRSGTYQVWIANASGARARPITRGAGGFTPVWFR